jgi:hypothetical protein
MGARRDEPGFPLSVLRPLRACRLSRGSMGKRFAAARIHVQGVMLVEGLL